jgi:hypothetical protein
MYYSVQVKNRSDPLLKDAHMPSFSELLAWLLHRAPDPLSVSLTTGLPVPARLSAQVHETDSNFYPGSNMSSLYRDRYDYDRQTILSEYLRAWRVNPIARRIVKLISMFVVGEGIKVQSARLVCGTGYRGYKHPSLLTCTMSDFHSSDSCCQQ